jgi:hypothetical protein
LKKERQLKKPPFSIKTLDSKTQQPGPLQAITSEDVVSELAVMTIPVAAKISAIPRMIFFMIRISFRFDVLNICFVSLFIP